METNKKTHTSLEEIAGQSRKDIVDMVYAAQSGHPGGSLSCIDILTVLYQEEIDLSKKSRNRFVLSKGHAAPALYAALARVGAIDPKELVTLRKFGSRLQGHPNMLDLPCVDMSTGSLGQGISAAVGMALGNKLKNDPHTVYCLVGDGEMEEGQVWEALMAASQYRLDNFVVFVDYNHLQISGRVEDVMDPGPLKEKLEAFGLAVKEIDGHDIQQIEQAIAWARKNDRPSGIIAHTIKGKGVSFMENECEWHGKAPNKKEYEQAKKEWEVMA